MSPRALLRSRRLLVLLAVSLGCATAACARDSATPRRAASGRGPSDEAVPVPEDQERVLRLPLAADPGSLNPMVPRAGRGRDFWPLLYPSLLSAEPRGAEAPAVRGDLARWWRWDPEAPALTCGLRGDRLWEDTTRVSIADVVRTYEAYRALGWFDRRTPSDSLPDAGLVSVRAVDDSTVRLGYRPEFSFWRAIAAASWPVLPARKLSDLTPAMLQANPLGREPLSAGPFRVSDLRPGLNLWLRPHPFAGASRRPEVDRADFEICPGIDARILRVLAGKADVALDVPVARLSALVEPNAEVSLHHSGIESVEMLLWNVRGPFSGPEIREALSLAIDRARIVRELLTWRGEACGGLAGGLLEPAGPPEIAGDGAAIAVAARAATGAAAPAVSGAADTTRSVGLAKPAAPDTISAPAAPALAPMPRYDLAAADSLLDAWGWSERDAAGYRVRGGSRLRIEMLYDRANQFRERTAALLEADLARAGIELAVVPADGASVWARLRSGLFATALVGFRPPVFPDASALWSSGGYWNGTGFASSQVDSLCVALGREEDAVRLGLLARTIESHIRRSGPATFLVYREWAALLGPRVRSFAGTAGDPLRELERVRLAEPTGHAESAGRAEPAERAAPAGPPALRDSGR